MDLVIRGFRVFGEQSPIHHIVTIAAGVYGIMGSTCVYALCERFSNPICRTYDVVFELCKRTNKTVDELQFVEILTPFAYPSLRQVVPVMHIIERAGCVDSDFFVEGMTRAHVDMLVICCFMNEVQYLARAIKAYKE